MSEMLKFNNLFLEILDGVYLKFKSYHLIFF